MVQFTNNYVHNAAVSVSGLNNPNYGPAAGGFPIDIVINNNTLNQQMAYPHPIFVYASSFNPQYVTGEPIKSATVLNNLLMNWQNAGPSVGQTQSVDIWNNTVTNSGPNF